MMYIPLKTESNFPGQSKTTFINTDHVAKIDVVEADTNISYTFISADNITLGSLVIDFHDNEQRDMMAALLYGRTDQ